jgi:hypothetical protein
VIRKDRKWIGIDITYVAVDLIRNRLRTTHGASIDETYVVLDELGRGKIFITVIAYYLDGKNSKSDLTEFAEQTLSEFDLTTTIN